MNSTYAVMVEWLAVKGPGPTVEGCGYWLGLVSDNWIQTLAASAAILRWRVTCKRREAFAESTPRHNECTTYMETFLFRVLKLKHYST